MLRGVALARLIQKRWVERKQEGVDRFSCGKRIRPHNECAQRATRFLIFFFFSVAGRTRELSEAGRGGFAGVSAAWMPRLSSQGRVHGVPRDPTPPGQARLLLYSAKQPATRGCAVG
ncbi:hypothetical protein C7E14_18470 [Stenotrophomonas maltophilia]|nr:hypothetical protein C7E14_18470 [Stenotrophomonas maltophilia]